MAVQYVICTDTPVMDSGSYRCHADVNTGLVADLSQAEINQLSSAVLGMFVLAFVFKHLIRFMFSKVSRHDG